MMGLLCMSKLSRSFSKRCALICKVRRDPLDTFSTASRSLLVYKTAVDVGHRGDDEERRFVLSIRMIFLLLAQIRPFAGQLQCSSFLHHHFRPLTKLHHRSCKILVFRSTTVIINREALYLPLRRCTTTFRALNRPLSCNFIKHFHRSSSHFSCAAYHLR